MRVLCLGHYSGERFEKDAVSVSKFIGFVWTEAKADSGKKKKKHPVSEISRFVCFYRAFSLRPWSQSDVNFNYLGYRIYV